MKTNFLLFVVSIISILSMSKSTAQNISSAQANQFLSSQGIEFVENRGQFVDEKQNPLSDILFIADMNGKKLYVRKTGLSYVLNRFVVDRSDSNDKVLFNIKQPERGLLSTHRVDMEIIGMNENVKIHPEEKSETYYNYYLPQCPDGITHVPVYKKIVYENAYNNIDFVVYENNNEPEYDFVIKPGGNPAEIKFELKDAGNVSVDLAGNLVIETPLGKIEQVKPYSYQIINGEKKIFESKFQIDEKGFVCFKTENYNKDYALVIDPIQRIWGTYYGNKTVVVNAIATDKDNNIIIVGYTGYDFNDIATPGAWQGKVYGDSIYGFIAKFSPNGKRIWGTYYGKVTNGFVSVCTDPQNNIIAVGFAAAGDTSNLTSPGAFQEKMNAPKPSTWYSTYKFFVKFSSDGQRQWATIIQGDGYIIDSYSHAYSDNTAYINRNSREKLSYVSTNKVITCDKNSNIYITGTTSFQKNMATPGAVQDTIFGYCDIYLAKFSPDGKRLWASYYGGSQDDYSPTVACDQNNNVVLAGLTESNDLLDKDGSRGGKNHGRTDIFIAKFRTDGKLLWRTYLGGSDEESQFSMNLDNNDNILISGITHSNDFPTTLGVEEEKVNTAIGLYGVGFLTDFSSTGGLNWSTFCSDLCDLIPTNLTCDKNNNAIITSFTYNDELRYTKGSYQEKTFRDSKNNYPDGFIALYSSKGRKKTATFFGGRKTDFGVSLAADSLGYIYFTGMTNSFNNIATKGTQKDTLIDTLRNSDLITFLAKLLYIKQPEISTDTLITKHIKACPDIIFDSIKVYNVGDTILKVNFSKAKFTSGLNHFVVVSPVKDTLIDVNKSVNLVLKYIYQTGDKTPIVDTLIIPSNDPDSIRSNWRVALKMAIDTISFHAYDRKVLHQIDTIRLGILSPGDVKDTVFILKNLSQFTVNLKQLISSDTADLKARIEKKTYFLIGDTGSVFIKYSSNKQGKQYTKIYFKILECPDYIDSIIVEAEIRVNPNQKAKIMGNPYFCYGDSTTLFAVPSGDGYTYLWSTGETTSQIVVTEGGRYNVIISYGMFYQDTAQIDVNEYPKPTVSIENSGANVFCEGDSIILDANGKYLEGLWQTSYQVKFDMTKGYPYWSTNVFLPGPWQNLIKTEITNDKSRTVLGVFGKQNVDLNLGALKQHDSVEVTYDLYIMGTWDGDSLTQNGPDIFEVTEKNALPKFDYQTTFSNMDTKLQSYPDLYQGGRHKNSTGCSETFVINLPDIYNNCDVYKMKHKFAHNSSNLNLSFVGNLKDQDPSFRNECWALDNVKIKILPSTPVDTGLNYNWSTGENTKSIKVKNSGKYTVYVTTSGGCIDSASIDINVLPNFEAKISGKNTICLGEKTVLSAEPTGSGYKYLWSTGDTAQTITVDSSGKYKVSITLNDLCTKIDSINVKINPKPEVKIIGDTIICNGITDTLAVNNNFQTYRWNTGETTKSIIINKSDSYSVTVTDTNGCTGTDSISVKLYDINITGLKDLDFGKIMPGKNNSGNFSVQNNSNTEVDILSIKTKNGTTEFKITSNPAVPIKLLKGDKLDITITFEPTFLKSYSDSLILEIGSPCPENLSSYLTGTTYAITTIFIPEIIAYIGTDSLCIPLKAIKDSNMVINDTLSYTAEIRYEASALIPKNQFPVEFGDRVISLSGSNIIFDKNEIELGDFCGDVMLANSDITPLRITKFKWNNPLIDTIIKDGNLIIKGLCAQSLSRLQLFTQTSFELIPNPANQIADIKYQITDDGNVKLTVYNMLGQEVAVLVNEEQQKGEHHYQFSIINYQLSSGMYMLCLRTSETIIFGTLRVVK